MLLEFHQKHGFAVGCDLRAEKNDVRRGDRVFRKLYDVKTVLAASAGTFENLARVTGSLRSLRAHLICEEAAEVMDGMLKCDEVELLDALCDLAYVVEGTGVAYGLPTDDGFHEVHRSNMTKDVRRPGDIRLRDKGETYQPPDLLKVLYAKKRGNS